MNGLDNLILLSSVLELSKALCGEILTSRAGGTCLFENSRNGAGRAGVIVGWFGEFLCYATAQAFLVVRFCVVNRLRAQICGKPCGSRERRL